MKAYLEQVVINATQLSDEEQTQLLGLFKDFEESFGGTLGDWYIETVNLESNPDSKPFNLKFYPVPRIDKVAFCNKLKRLMKIWLLTQVQQS